MTTPRPNRAFTVIALTMLAAAARLPAQLPVAQRRPEQLCGLVPPPGWQQTARYDHAPPRLGLPASFDWRAQGGCPPVRDQGTCGSCWAFGTVGPLECSILIHDGLEVDLSEQWLINCNRETPKWGCGGGWWAHDYHWNTTDSCGDSGAVLESAVPYTESDGTCGCPYDHPYAIDGWLYVGGGAEIPSVTALKQAILDHGPVSAAVHVEGAFFSYAGGVYRTHYSGEVNHGIVLVGWDDNQGTAGVWILRNSWGPAWGDGGYMLIEYGCCSVGYGACYVLYSGPAEARIEITPAALDFGDVVSGGSATRAFTVRNAGGQLLSGSAGGLSAPFSLDGATAYELAPGASQDVTVRFSPAGLGTFSGTATFSGGGGATAGLTGRGIDTQHTISGRVTAASGGGVADVVLTGLPDDPVTDASGNYSARVDHGFAGTVTPQKAGCAFTPASRTYTGVSGDLPGQDYTVTPPSFVISGRVTDEAGNPVAGVLVTGLPGSPATGPDGQYSATVAQGFSGTAAPAKAAYTFEPPTRTYTGVSADVPGQDYTGRPQTGSLRIVLAPAEVLGAGVAWQVDAGAWHGSGETVAGLIVGQHTLNFAPLTGWTEPGSETVTIVADQTTSLTRTYVQRLFELHIETEPAGAGLVTANPPPGPGGLYPWDTHVMLTAVPQSGFRVRNWLGADLVPASGSPTNTVTMTAARTVVVHFEIEPFTLYQLEARVAGGRGAVWPTRLTARAGTVVALTAAPADQFRVARWTGTDNDASVELTNTVTLSSSRTVTVAFAPLVDCNADGLPDAENIAAGTSTDCNANGVPDECEVDSDGDGLIDACDAVDDRAVPAEQSDPPAPPPAPPAPFRLCGAGLIESLAPLLVTLTFLRRSRAGTR